MARFANVNFWGTQLRSFAHPVFLSEKLAQYLQGKGPSVPNVVFAGGGAKI